MIEVVVATPGSSVQLQSLALRNEILMDHIGLHLTFDPTKELNEYHICALFDGKVVGTLLLQPQDDPKSIKMRQVCVSKQHQRKGIGKLMLVFAENLAKTKQYEQIELHAQITAIEFYLATGYQIEGNWFEEAGIQHKTMFKLL